MRLSQSASISSPKQGNGNRLGARTRKKHKRLDAITEDVFNRNHKVKIGSNEGASVGGAAENDSELRRSTRVRRAPMVLDLTPSPMKRRRKNGKLGKNIEVASGMKSRDKAKLESEVIPAVFGDEEEDGYWRSRLRSRDQSESSGVKVNVYQRRGKRKLVEDLEDNNEDLKIAVDEMVIEDGEKSRVIKSVRPGRVMTLIDGEDELHDEHPGVGGLENGIDDLRNEDGGDCNPSKKKTVDEREEIADRVPVGSVEKESQDAVDALVQEKRNKQNMIENFKDSELNDEPVNSPSLDEDAGNEVHSVEVPILPTDEVRDEEMNGVDEVTVVESKREDVELENGAKQKTYVCSGGLSRPRIKEGRHCGLCGGGTDGKPPKRLTNESTGSDHEAYSGASDSEEFDYDIWDGFGDEPGWLGRLLGPINDRYGIAGIWVHQHCAVWSPEVYFAGLGCLKNVKAALCRGRALKCTRCRRPGATLGCRVDRCPKTYHLPCARASGCIFDHRKFLIACADHRYLFEPHGYQYSLHIKKLKAKKMKMEMRKLSNDASRKDLEAEEKWMENCGEDEEFLRRETKRLQRDLLRISPVYIGGRHSEGEKLFEGWESVAGLQDVVRCMKEVVILPLLYPEFFENMGITPPRGVLLHGHPGTGKTLVVRALIGSCARGDRRIAYFARKGADCLGKYVGVAERQLRLLFQVAEKSQPSIIFFDEIDGLAPVRTRQQDQTHSSVVSTLLALMDGLKSRGSVIVIGATNRPDAVDPALRRPGRFDREIYFPLPSAKDRAAILALHTRKWPKPVAGPLLEWVAGRTVGFAGADLQALCAQAALIALKRNCQWEQILSVAGKGSKERKRLMQLPSFSVEERDWLEALSHAPPPCSRREAGMAANEIKGSPLPIHLIPSLLQPLLSLIISLYVDERLWLPFRLANAGAAIERGVVSLLEKKGSQTDRWWCHAASMIQELETSKETLSNLLIAGIFDGDPSFTVSNMSNGVPSEHGDLRTCNSDSCPSGLVRNLFHSPAKDAGYRILIAGDPRSGQKHLASCILHCFEDSIEFQKIDLTTISQEGHGNMELGISQILMKCASVKMCAVFMPRIDLWATNIILEPELSSDSLLFQSSLGPLHPNGEDCSLLPSEPELNDVTEPRVELHEASVTWKSFMEQLECIGVSSSLIILATSELPYAALPQEVRCFFSGDLSRSEGSVLLQKAMPRFSVELDGEFHRDMLLSSASVDLSRDLIQQFVHLVHYKNHAASESRVAPKTCCEGAADLLNNNGEVDLMEELEAKGQQPAGGVVETPSIPEFRNVKGKSSLGLAIGTFGYQLLRYPHFAELCWVTSKLKEGPSADTHGPWKGWPFNSCIVRPSSSMPKGTGPSNSSSIKGKDKFSLVRGLVAVGLSAYTGSYTSPTEVSQEVRKVLELLVLKIGARIQSGKNRYQYVRLLSQVAYFEDIVNSWAHSLRSLEPDSEMTSPKVTGVQSADEVQTAACDHMEVEEEPNIQDTRVQEPETVGRGSKGPYTKSFGPSNNIEGANVGGDATELVKHSETSQNKVLSSNDSAGALGSHSKEEPADQDEGLRVIVLGLNAVPTTDLDGSTVNGQSCNVISNGKDCSKSEALGFEHSEDLAMRGQVHSSENCSSKAEKHIVDEAGLPDLNLPSKRSTGQFNAGVCSYNCCMGCIYKLHQLVKKIVARYWEISDCCTVEDFHDLVSSLSTSLCSIIRNFYVTGRSGFLHSEEQRYGTSRKFDSQEMNACQCEILENDLTVPRECVCHPGEDSSREVNYPVPYNLPEFNRGYLFRDGVSVSAEPQEEVAFHCKFSALCLCSLIELIVITKQPSDCSAVSAFYRSGLKRAIL